MMAELPGVHNHLPWGGISIHTIKSSRTRAGHVSASAMVRPSAAAIQKHKVTMFPVAKLWGLSLPKSESDVSPPPPRLACPPVVCVSLPLSLSLSLPFWCIPFSLACSLSVPLPRGLPCSLSLSFPHLLSALSLYLCLSLLFLSLALSLSPSLPPLPLLTHAHGSVDLLSFNDCAIQPTQQFPATEQSIAN